MRPAELTWEGEVVAYVGATLVDATPEQALAAVVGCSTFNDLTSRRAQKLTSQWILGKNGDRSGPLVPAAEVGRLRVLRNTAVPNDARVGGGKSTPSSVRATSSGRWPRLAGPTGRAP